jgi:50S ribosomal protein L16 3-hydroxylase
VSRPDSHPAMLGGLALDHFLSDYWQRKPLLIRAAFPDFEPPLDGGELAGLALEAEVESRLISGRVGGTWTLRHGPFEEHDFLRAPEHDWTLLVQDVEKHVPECAWIIDAFACLPAWRLDDLMVSYAAPGGSVGPHVDAYDVFLLQGEGQRRWQIGEPGTGRAMAHGALRQLADFEARDEWLLGPGDMLYLPPGVPHYGVAETACTTWSIGLRALSLADLVSELAELVDEQPEHREPLPDRHRTPAAHPRELTYADLDALRRPLRALLSDSALLERAIARAASRPKPGFLDAGFEPSETTLHTLPDSTLACQHPAVRIALLPASAERAGEVCVNGESSSRDPGVYALVRALTSARCVPLGAIRDHLQTPAQQRWLHDALTRGHWELG